MALAVTLTALPPITIPIDPWWGKAILALPGATVSIILFYVQKLNESVHKAEVQFRDRSEAIDLIQPAIDFHSKSPMQLMQANHCNSPYQDPDSCVEKLNRWLRADETKVAVISGAALTGKKRLVYEWSRQLSKTWTSGWLRPGMGNIVLDRIAPCGENTIIFVDKYGQDLINVLERLDRYQGHPKIRIVIIVRNIDGLHQRLRRTSTQASNIIENSYSDIHLTPIGSRVEQKEWFDELCRYYATRTIPPIASSDHAPMPTFTQEPPIGLLHVAAFTALSIENPEKTTFDLRRRLDYLWEKEVATWRESRTDTQWGLGGLSDIQIEVAAISLAFAPVKGCIEARAILDRLPLLAEITSSQKNSLLDWAQHNYPPDGFESGTAISIRPHIVVDQAFSRIYSKNVEGIKSALFPKEKPVPRELIARIISAVSMLPEHAMILEDIAKVSSDNFKEILEQALLLDAYDAMIDQALANAAGACTWSNADIKQLLNSLPGHLLVQTGIALGEVFINQFENNVSSSSGPHSEQLAHALTDQHKRLMLAGGREKDVLRTISHAVSIWEKLADKAPGAYQINLAIALTFESKAYLILGNKESDAFHSIIRSIALLEQAAMDGSKATDKNLADALVQQAVVFLQREGQENQALETISRAVRLYDNLDAGDLIDENFGYAHALGVQAGLYASLGNCVDKELEATSRAVSKLQELSDSLSSDTNFELALALSNQSLAYRRIRGHGQESLDASIKCITLLKELTEIDPIKYNAFLAEAIVNHAEMVHEVDTEGSQFMESITESVSIFDGLRSINPTRFDPDYAHVLIHQAYACSLFSSRIYEALEIIKNSLVICNRLYALDADRHAGLLGEALLTETSIYLKHVDRRQDALSAATKAVTLSSKRIRAEFPESKRALAVALNAQASVYVEMEGQANKAVEAFSRSSEIFEELAFGKSGFEVVDWVLSLINLAHGHISLNYDIPKGLSAVRQSVCEYARWFFDRDPNDPLEFIAFIQSAARVLENAPPSQEELLETFELLSVKLNELEDKHPDYTRQFHLELRAHIEHVQNMRKQF